MILSVSAVQLGLFFLFWRSQAMPVLRDASETLLSCESGCQSGYGCNTTSGLCVPIECTDCSHAANDPVCGLDGRTYINSCELSRSNCLNNISIGIKHSGSCIMACKQLSDEILKRKLARTQQETREARSRLRELCRNEEATIDDLITYFYKPTCLDDGTFALRQKNDLCGLYWCVTRDGHPITNFTSSDSSMCDNIHTELRSCIGDNGETYHSGAYIKVDCGWNICTDGKIMPFVSDYCQNTFTEEQLVPLQRDVLYLFHHQYNKRNHEVSHSLVDIRINVPVMTDSLIYDVLSWKFYNYDLNEDRQLDSSEMHNVHKTISRLIQTSSFINIFTSALNTNADLFVSLDEWMAFFSFDQGSSSGSNPVASGVVSTQGI